MRAFLVSLLLACSLGACNLDAPGAPATDGTSESSLLFAVQSPVEGGRAVMEALYEGRVLEIDGCLRIDSDSSHTVVWPPGFTLADHAGVRTVYDETGRAVAQIGGFFRLGGGEVSALWENGPVDESTRRALIDRCPGRYWIVGKVEGND